MTIVLSDPVGDIPDGDIDNSVPPGTNTIQSIPGSGAAGAEYSYHQTSPASVWTIDHNLGTPREPVILLDDDPTNPVWTDVVHASPNQTTLIFPSPATGWAYF